MTDSRIPELDNLYSEIRSYRSTKEFKYMLDFITKFKELGPYNTALVYRLRPGSIYVATPSGWRNKFSRYIKPGVCTELGPRSYSQGGTMVQLLVSKNH